MSDYTTQQGDTVDYIAWKFYGKQDRQSVEQVLAVNPGLSDYGPELPGGLAITMPVLVAGTVAGVKLWD